MNDKMLMKLIRATWGPDADDETLFAMVGLAGEVGEVANLAAKGMRGDFAADEMSLVDHPGLFKNSKEWAKVVDRRERLIGELGGVLYYWRALCWRLGVEPDEIVEKLDEKLRSRLERGVIRGDGDDR
jgi:NTP pyrophosphatase (non-canonical NTP hydrolase)